jgi:hypothetical protein
MASVKTPTPPPAPTPISAADEYRKTADMMSDPALQQKMLDVEKQLRPQYAALNLADLQTYQGGLLGLQEATTRQSAALERETLAAQRQADIGDVEKYGGRATAAMRAADPYSTRMAELSQQAAEQAYAASGRVTPEQMRGAQQAARAGGLARGRVGDQSTIASEILGREDILAKRRAEAAQAGQMAFGMNRAISADPFQAILGRQSGALGYGAQQMGMAQQLGSQAIGPRAVDYNAGLNLAMQNASNLGSYNTSIFGAQSQFAGAQEQARGAMIGGALSGLGAIGGGFASKCWVAREVYGENNPKWMLFREWLNNHAPKWFDSLYVKHGEKFAIWIANKPLLKSVIRKWMDSRIAVLISTKGLSYA